MFKLNYNPLKNYGEWDETFPTLSATFDLKGLRRQLTEESSSETVFCICFCFCLFFVHPLLFLGDKESLERKRERGLEDGEVEGRSTRRV